MTEVGIESRTLKVELHEPRKRKQTRLVMMAEERERKLGFVDRVLNEEAAVEIHVDLDVGRQRFAEFLQARLHRLRDGD